MGLVSWAFAHETPPDAGAPPFVLADGASGARARLVPDAMSVATVGDYRLEVTAGAGGAAALLIDFPKSWFTNPFPLIKQLQRDKPSAPHHVRIEGPAAHELVVSWSHVSLHGEAERFRHLMHVEVVGDPLAEGDVVVLELANTTAPEIAGFDEVTVAVDPGDGRFRLAPGAAYEVSPGARADTHLFAPSQAVRGEAVDLQVVDFDAFWNVVEVHRSSWSVSASEAEGGGDYAWPEVELPDGRRVTGGPIRLYDQPPPARIYWGDLHSHSRISKDGVGSDDFAYARDVTRLDFYAATEHAGDDNWLARRDPAAGLRAEEWEEILRQVRELDEPGRFVTLLAYECSLGGGHHNVFFRGLDGVPLPPHAVGDIDTLWARLAAGEALTIPHHPGILWGGGSVVADGPELQPVVTAPSHGGGPRIEWRHERRPEPGQESLRPALEIYSAHGQSEHYDPTDPLAYEQVRFTPAASADGAFYARDAWAAGHPLAVVAASDNHSAMPGLPHFGLTAVRAPALTREAVFDALAQGRSYGTTGERILLDFALVDGEGTVEVAAPSPIRFVEVMAWDGDAWRPAVRWESPGRVLRQRFSIEGTRVAYLRVELERRTGGRVARAWSSPIWNER